LNYTAILVQETEVKKKSFKIGLCSNLCINGSIHTSTFIDSSSLAINMLNTTFNCIEYHFFNDSASAAGGVLAAHNIIKKDINCVVGHYSSASAQVAAPIYEENNIPLILPAATSINITTQNNNTYRVCGNDEELSKCLIEHIYSKTSIRKLHLVNDDSYHGISLTNSIRCALNNIKALSICDFEVFCDAVIFIGTYSDSIEFVKNKRKEGFDKEIYLTDDALHSQLIHDLKGYEKDVYVFGFSPSNWNVYAENVNSECQVHYNKYPGTYFLETYTAIQIALSLSKYDSNNYNDILNTHNWQTAIGNIQFISGESNYYDYALWSLEPNKLSAKIRYSNYKEEQYNECYY